MQSHTKLKYPNQLKSCTFLLIFSWESDSWSLSWAIIAQESLVVMRRIHCKTHHGTLSEWIRHRIQYGCLCILIFVLYAYGHGVLAFAFYSGTNKTRMSLHNGQLVRKTCLWSFSPWDVIKAKNIIIIYVMQTQLQWHMSSNWPSNDHHSLKTLCSTKFVERTHAHACL